MQEGAHRRRACTSQRSTAAGTAPAAAAGTEESGVDDSDAVRGVAAARAWGGSGAGASSSRDGAGRTQATLRLSDASAATCGRSEKDSDRMARAG